ncbi:RNA polymerase sigma factor [Hyphomonas jannaschiana]|uniref:RNA polymerase sigma factor n=1 Tax=Hyphomonas jannaschiana TaxID=86 RepID=UPI0035C763B7
MQAKPSCPDDVIPLGTFADAADVPVPDSNQADEADRARFLSHLFRQHYGELVGRLRKIHGAGPPEPEDVAQAAFSKLAGLPDLGRIRSPRAFLFRTAINLGLNSNDKLRRGRNFVKSQMDGNFSPDVEEISPETVLMGKQDLERVARAMQQLSPKQKEILLRSRFRGQTYAEIKRDTGWSEADISRQLSSVMALLQAGLDG